MIADYLARIVFDVRQLAQRAERSRDAWILIRVFYIFAGYVAAERITAEPWHVHAGAFEPLWPLLWAQTIAPETLMWILLAAAVAVCTAAAAAPHNRMLRIVALVSLLSVGAFINSFGKIGHNLHYWIYVAAIFVFLPSRTNKDADTLTLTTFWCAQFVILSTYALAGLWKVVRALMQSSEGLISIFNVSGPVHILVNRTLKNGEVGVIGEWFTAHPEILWGAFWIVVLVQCTVLVVAYLPRLHRIAGIVLIAFHVGIYLAMDISFIHVIPLLGLLFVCSPLGERAWSFSDRSLNRSETGH
ncbi:MAG TPA: hypothetical protein VNM40_01145 [Candidatus Paceibacterota bacterium]|nr:hypothetical protein [Candidatus Paceibacterota bacterium]